MCGRFVGYRKLGDYQDKFRIELFEVDPKPNYNVAPSQMVPAVIRENDQNVLRAFKWGLVPFWAKDISIGNRLINARSETVDSKPAYRAAFKKRRCLIPADGFYEWQGPKGNKQPMYITTRDDSPFGFAGLWEVWDARGRAGEALFTCTILTTEASAVMQDIHHRMPAILKPEVFDKWIDENTSENELKDILQSQIEKDLTYRPVSKAVNAARNNSADLIEAIES
jgi:putative SOS response-associated peptidase YedK